ncbi:MAG TPA: HAMP domain-containing histidine kinase [Candidatus Ventricola intestinavium]|nr:HAMP domain-containing histidine kinase [Candidatus Ventricola intestinavium]
MTIRQRMARANLIMLVIPVGITVVLLALGIAITLLLLQNIYLPQMGLTLRDLHDAGEWLEHVFSGLRTFGALYMAAVVLAILASVAFTHVYLTRSLFRHLSEPLDALVAGVERIRQGNLDAPIAYGAQDEFKAACDAVDLMAARLRASLEEQQAQQQKKQELFAGLSHDLKSPLTTIRAYTEALLEGIARDEPTKQRYLQTIYTRETEIEAMVNRLFELARMGVSEYPVCLEAMEAGSEIRRMAKAVDAGDMTVSFGPLDAGAVWADRQLLTRIVANLLDNSRKYGKKGEARVRIAVKAAGDGMEITFRDNGPGVPEEQLPRIFDAFYRGSPAREKPGGGSGLGLAVVKRAVEQMGGTVGACNAEQGGLCVTLRLPRAEEKEAEDEQNPDHRG